MEKDLVSVIIPVYNVEKYLHKCVDSIINQTYNNLEIILVDDGSTDSSGILCDDYKQQDKRIRVLHQVNTGQAIARNNALDVANGDYITFVDGDDYIKQNMIFELMQVIYVYKADLVCSSFVFETATSQSIHNYVKEIKVYNKNEELLKAYFEKKMSSTLCNKLFNKKLWDNVRMPPLRAREDAYILPEILAKCNKAVLIPTAYYVQFLSENSTERSNFTNKNLATIDVALNTKRLINESFTNLQYHTKNIMADAYVSCMKEIILKNGYSEFKDIYFNLKSKLYEEVQTYSEADKEKYSKILHHNFLWRFILQLKRIKTNVRQMAKKVLVKFKILR